MRAAVALAASLAVGAVFAAAPATAQVTIALVPHGTDPAELAERGLSPGIWSAGLGEVDPAQTYLDITQGNRVFDSLYDVELPPLRVLGGRVQGWEDVRERAESAPADLEPGLLAAELGGLAHGRPTTGVELVLGADRGGEIRGIPRVIAIDRAGLRREASALGGRDLLIALAAPSSSDDPELLTIGIAGRGFDGNLTSDSTRLDGYVLSTDIAPTILERLGVPIPGEMSGQPIEATGDIDPAAVSSLADRLDEIADRRGTVLGVNVVAWVLLAGLAIAIGRRRAAGVAAPLLALAAIYLPALLLLTAALEPSETAERLIVGLGAPIAAAATFAVFRDRRSLALACAVTVAAYAIDVLAGSPLTSLSLMGPNPALGVRFYGIGNELEATLVVLSLLGVGTGLAAFRPEASGRAYAWTFVAAGVALAFVFAAGRFGADVGAAIVFPLGAAMAAVAVMRGGRRGLLLALATPVAALAALAAIDLVSGGEAHLTRSVLDAGGFEEVADVAERRLELSARSFVRAAGMPYLWLALVLIGLGICHRRTVLGWFDSPPARAGFLGAAAATLVGTLANDSGALVLELGTGFLLLAAVFAWVTHGRNGSAGAV